MNPHNRHRVPPSRVRRAATATVICAAAAGLVAVAPAAQAQQYHTRTTTEARIAASVLNQLNRERHAHHLPALRSEPHLQLSARRHDAAMARAGTLSHQLPHEASFTRRISDAGYRWSWAGENIGVNSQMTARGALYLQTLMYDERPPNDGHRRNILSSHYRDVGVDVFLDQRRHRVWLTTDFGRR